MKLINKAWLFTLCMTGALITGCGGSGGGNDDPEVNTTGGNDDRELNTTIDPNGTTVLSSTHRPTLVGVVIDSIVINLHYGTASTTNEKGEFNYQSGDLITFKIGDITLPPVQGSPVITVFDIANAQVNTNRYLNIARFLQSLDSDGDVSNGINISDIAHSSATGETLNFDEDPSQFTTDANPLIATIHAAGGTSNTQLIDSATADINARAALNSLAKTTPIAGTYSTGTGATLQVAVFLDNSEYYMLDGNCDGLPSYELGFFTYNTSTNQITTTLDDDSDGASCGLNNGTYSVGISGSSLTLDGKTWQRVMPVTGTINGIYGGGDLSYPSAGLAALHVFLASGEYIELFDCTGSAGVEAGQYTWNATTNVLTVSAVSKSTTTCGRNSTSAMPAPVTAFVSADFTTIEVRDGNDDDGYGFDRIDPGLTGNSLIGAWDTGDILNGGLLIFTSSGEILANWGCTVNSNSRRVAGNYVWDSATGDAKITVTQNGAGDCGLNTLAPIVQKLEVHGNILSIVTPEANKGTISVNRDSAGIGGGLQGVWQASSPALTIGIYEDLVSKEMVVHVIASDCPISSVNEDASFQFDAATSTISNFGNVRDVSGCGLPATFGPNVTLSGDTLTIDGLGQFNRVK